jgi:hypothetical protein
MVTHERDTSAWVSRTVMLADGQIANGALVPTAAMEELYV